MGEIPNSNPESNEPDIYRDKLAEQLKNMPKEERREILDQAKENPEYWEARNKKIEGRQNKEEIDDDLGIFVKNKTLYHGSRSSGIKKFRGADDTTIGEGLYCTSKPKDAINYAHLRSGSNRPSVLYEISIESLKLLDLRSDEKLKRISQEYRPVLEGELNKLTKKAKTGQSLSPIEGWKRDFLRKAIQAIDSGKTTVSNIQDIIGQQGQLFTDFALSKGYHGLISVEGGEGEFRKSNHDSYLIFDPEKVKIVKEQKIKKKNN